MWGRRFKFIAGSAIILGVLVWLGVSGVQESKTYYVTIPEMRAQGDHAYKMRLRVAGDVLPGSIRREGRTVRFQLHQANDRLEVVYVGTEPLPDTLVDNAQAIVTGQFTREQYFRAEKVQAKCASKYEALPPGAQPKASPTQTSAVQPSSP